MSATDDRRGHRALGGILLLAPLLAGCLGLTPPDNLSSNDGPLVVDPEADPIHPGGLPHVHDRWAGASVKVLLDDTVRMKDPMDPTEHSNLWDFINCASFCNVEVDVSLSEGSIVPPGAERVTVEAMWNHSTVRFGETNLLLSYQAANQTELRPLDWQDGPAAWSINTSVEMSDEGHAQYSLWRFRLTACECLSLLGEGWEFPIDIKITAHRRAGPLPIEPPHPDWWANGTERPVWSDEGTVARFGYGESYASTDGGIAFGGSYMNTVNREDHSAVPPGTHLMSAWFNWTNDAAGSEVLEPVPWLAWDNTDWDFHLWQPSEVHEGSHEYVLPVTDRMVDGMYGEQSRWRFRYGFWGDDQSTEDPAFGGPADPYTVDGEWSVVIKVYNATASPSPDA